MTENLINRIRFYLASGGLFNPELADHIAVRTLLFECREALTQRTWVGLTDEEILAVNMSTVTKLIDEPIVCDTDHNIVQLGKSIEAKLKEKNA